MTHPPYEGATEEQLSHPKVRELLAVHGMFRDQLAAMLDYVDDLLNHRHVLSEPETAQRTRALIQAGVQYTTMLHHHHHLETSFLFPILGSVGLERAVTDKLNADHDDIAVLIDKFGSAVREYAAVDPDAMDSDLRRLSDALTAHLAYEETHICPYINLLPRTRGW